MLYQSPVISRGTKSSQCDEQKPECINCQKKGLQCCYTSGTTPLADSDKVVSKQAPSSTLFSLSLDSITRDIQETLTRLCSQLAMEPKFHTSHEYSSIPQFREMHNRDDRQPSYSTCNENRHDTRFLRRELRPISIHFRIPSTTTI